MRRGLPLIALYAVLTAAAVAPVFVASEPVLVDYPMHVARMWILRHDSDIPALAANYLVHWRLAPYLAMDLAVTALAWAMPVALASKLFVVVTMAALVGGTAVLHRAVHGRIGWWPLASLLFLYNAVLFFGFLNCLFGIAMFLFAFAGWIASPRWPPLWRIPAFALVAAALFVLHLFAFGLYGLAVASWELGGAVTRRAPWRGKIGTLVLAALQFVPALLLWWLSLGTGGADYAHYGTLNDKLFALFAATSFGDPPTTFDHAFWLIAVAGLALGLLSGSLRLAPRMIPVLAAMLVAAVAMPNWISGSWGADFRLPAILPFLLIAAIGVERTYRRAAIAAGAAALLLFGLRLWAVTGVWHDGAARIAEFRVADAAISPGARLFPVFSPMPDEAGRLPGIPAWLARRQEVSLAHLDAYAVIDRAAFIPDMFIAWMTVDAAPRNAGLHQIVAPSVDPALLAMSADPKIAATLPAGPDMFGERPFWIDWPRRFDYVLWIDYGTVPAHIPPMLRPVAHGSYFHLYRITRN